MSIEVLYIMSFFILGTIMGSFYNVVGYRLPNGMSLIKPASHCPKCNHRLGAMELIPIISYIIQLGKCKHCKTKIAAFYPIFEFLTGIVFVISYLVFGFTNELLIALTFSSILLIVIISDYKYMIIPDELLLFAGVVLIIERLYIKFDVISLLLDAAIPFVAMLLLKFLGDFLFKKESLGGGDIKLMAIFGLAIGWQGSLLSIILAAFIALPISLIILAIRKTNIIPFGPFLSIAALIIYFSSINYVNIINWLLGM